MDQATEIELEAIEAGKEWADKQFPDMDELVTMDSDNYKLVRHKGNWTIHKKGENHEW